MEKRTKIKQLMAGVLSAVVLAASGLATGLIAAENAAAFGLSPMYQVMVLTPGETYRNTIEIVNRDIGGSGDFNYMIEVKPFDMNGSENLFDESSAHNLITEWISINGDETGTIPYGESKEVEYVINVPLDAPAGGQYAAIMVSENPSGSSSESDSFGIQENLRISYLIYAEVAGTTIRQGEILSADVPGFLISGSIKGSAEIKNTGNVHGTAKYTLKVFPLFSDEELYTNEEDPASFVILPDRTYYNETAWTETPELGIFNVVYQVEFEGVTAQVSKMVVKCPIWLIFIILFIIFALIFYFVAKAKARKKSVKRSQNA